MVLCVATHVCRNAFVIKAYRTQTQGHRLRRRRRKFRRRLFAAGLALLLLASLGVACAYYCPQQILTVESGTVKADVIVVMGGGWIERSQRAAELYAEGAAPKILVSGAGDCAVCRSLLLGHGVPEDAIQMEC